MEGVKICSSGVVGLKFCLHPGLQTGRLKGFRQSALVDAKGGKG